MNFCPYCMEPLNSARGQYCPKCGGSLNYQTPETHLAPGSVVHGEKRSYCVGAARGQGGFGITYVACELETGRKVAVKEYFPIRCGLRGPDGSVMPKKGMEGEFRKGYDNFYKEAARLVGVKPIRSIVCAWSCLVENGTAYLVMDYIEGKPLHQVVKERGGRISAQDLLPRLPQLIRDIGELHREQMLHRDISPDNIMWMNSGELKLIDFGSARSMEGDQSMTVMLKAGFSPLEQYMTHGQGPWTDVYGLCATIYYCLTGTVPPAAIDRMSNPEMDSPAALGAALSPQEDAAIMRGLAVQPIERIRSAEELFRALYPQEIPPEPVFWSETCQNDPNRQTNGRFESVYRKNAWNGTESGQAENYSQMNRPNGVREHENESRRDSGNTYRGGTQDSGRYEHGWSENNSQGRKRHSQNESGQHDVSQSGQGLYGNDTGQNRPPEKTPLSPLMVAGCLAAGMLLIFLLLLMVSSM